MVAAGEVAGGGKRWVGSEEGGKRWVGNEEGEGEEEGGAEVSFAERHAGCRALSETLEQHITND